MVRCVYNDPSKRITIKEATDALETLSAERYATTYGGLGRERCVQV